MEERQIVFIRKVALQPTRAFYLSVWDWKQVTKTLPLKDSLSWNGNEDLDNLVFKTLC